MDGAQQGISQQLKTIKQLEPEKFPANNIIRKGKKVSQAPITWTMSNGCGAAPILWSIDLAAAG